MSEDVIRARIETELKKAFEAACKSNDRTASQVMREMIKRYVTENAQGILPMKGGRK